ncbi:hypothetical protein ACFX2I_038855 [Malus domestica]
MWGTDEDTDLRQSWGSFVLTRDLPLGCDGKRAGWEVYHPNFMARQLGYLQGCPVPLLSSRTVLSRGREPGSSEKECNIAKREFQEQCQSFRLRPAIPETLSTNTFGEWWEKYTHEFFGVPVETVLDKLFGDQPKKAYVSQAQGSRPLKKVEAVAAAVAKKKSIVSKKTEVSAQALPSKQPRREAEPIVEPPRPAKRVKKAGEERRTGDSHHLQSNHESDNSWRFPFSPRCPSLGRESANSDRGSSPSAACF